MLPRHARPPFHSSADKPPPFCEGRAKDGDVQLVEVPSNYPDLSPNPFSRQFHTIQDEFRKGGGSFKVTNT